MRAIIAMAVSLILLVILLRKKVKVGFAMLIASVTLAAILLVTPLQMYRHFLYEFQTKPITQTTAYLFVSLAALITFVNLLGAAMRYTGISDRLVPAMLSLFRSRRFALASMPLLMGLLPTPGGIMLSAPMVRDLGDSLAIPRPRLAAINFFFRHQWESVWPLFPAIPLIEGILNVPPRDIIAHNLIICVTGLIVGSITLLLKPMPSMKNAEIKTAPIHHNIKDLTHAFWPIFLAAVLYAGLNFPPAVGLFLALIVFSLLHKVSFRTWKDLFKDAAKLDFILLIFAAVFFKFNLQAANAIPDAMEFLEAAHIPPLLIVFGLPFIVAFLTGITAATVALTFPFLSAIIGTAENADLSLMTLAFAGIIAGLHVTPVHMCLPLSAAYFDAPLPAIIKQLIVPAICISIAGFIVVFLK